MITITINGLDQFVVSRLSREMSKSLSNLYEVNESEINFIAPQSMVFHRGVEQTSWHVIVNVTAPKKTQAIQKHVADFLIQSIKDVGINIEILFTYFSSDEHVEHLNRDYPLYITEQNIVEVEDEEDDSDIGDEEIFDGNIFKDFDERGKR